eukprot:14569646-Alexandrium_andersonii.AAC.1
MRRDFAALREALARHGLRPSPAARTEEPSPMPAAAPPAAAASSRRLGRDRSRSLPRTPAGLRDDAASTPTTPAPASPPQPLQTTLH